MRSASTASKYLSFYFLYDMAVDAESHFFVHSVSAVTRQVAHTIIREKEERYLLGDHGRVHAHTLCYSSF